MGNFWDAPIRREGHAVSYDPSETKDRYIVDTWRGGYRVIVQRWDGYASVVGEYLTKKEAEGIKKLLESNYGNS